MRRSAVIGANWGDEGKGLVTDYLSGPKTLVVRFNGGAQAGHTVVTPDGQRHVFHHFGSGSLRHATTFLSRFFVVNPILFLEEARELRSLGVHGKVAVDPSCLVTTPYDMMINQAIERKRAGGRHGSCGVGINETIRRSKDGCTLAITDMMSRAAEDLLRHVRDDYVPRRLATLGLEPSDLPHLKNDEILVRYLADTAEFLKSVSITPWSNLSAAEDIVFEGAQGLQLDMDSSDFPYVTHSKTGIANVLELVREAGDKTLLNVHYVTRAYFTRHGAGPLPNELERPPYEKIIDKTNIENPHQGKLRFAILDLQALFHRIHKDLLVVKTEEVCPWVTMTCVDQLDDGQHLDVQEGPQKRRMSVAEVYEAASARDFQFEVGRGPTHEALEEWEEQYSAG